MKLSVNQSCLVVVHPHSHLLRCILGHLYGFGDLKQLKLRFPVAELEQHRGLESGDWNDMTSSIGSKDCGQSTVFLTGAGALFTQSPPPMIQLGVARTSDIKTMLTPMVVQPRNANAQKFSTTGLNANHTH